MLHLWINIFGSLSGGLRASLILRRCLAGGGSLLCSKLARSIFSFTLHKTQKAICINQAGAAVMYLRQCVPVVLQVAFLLTVIGMYSCSQP